MNRACIDVVRILFSTIAVNCPFCTTMITDGVKAADRIDTVEVLDIAEIVRRSVQDPA